MPKRGIEYLWYTGESPQDNGAYLDYLDDLQRGKSLIQLTAVYQQMTPFIRSSWSARTFGPVWTPAGSFDEIVCNVSYHYQKHGSKFGSILLYTQEALRYFKSNQQDAIVEADYLKLPKGLYEIDGRIMSFFG